MSDATDRAGTPAGPVLGWVDGAGQVNEQRFDMLVAADAVVAVDDLVTVSQTLADGSTLTSHGIVVATSGLIEGAERAADTRRISAERTMPGEVVRRVEVATLRMEPERWIAPLPGATVHPAVGAARDAALFVDQMRHPFPFGLDSTGAPVPLAFEYLDGTKGGHVNISGISGVATKTSTALTLLYLLFEGPGRLDLLGARSSEARALLFAVKGEDLLHLDTPNGRWHEHPEAAEGWQGLGIDHPGAFTSLALCCPRHPESRPGHATAWVESRSRRDVRTFGWTPAEFIERGLLPYAFSDTDAGRTQVGFVLERVTELLRRWARPAAGEPGAVRLAPPADLAAVAPGEAVGFGFLVRDFGDLADFLAGNGDDVVGVLDDTHPHAGVWRRSDAGGTIDAFVRRLHALRARLGFLVDTSATAITLDREVTVVDLHNLHDSAQKFVVGAVLSQVFADKQSQGREPLRFVVLDELNKYAPREGTSPLKELLIDIAERGRSLGVLLIGAQQAASAVAPAIIRNAAIKIVGRLDAAEAAEYRFLTPELRERATRFLPGTMVLAQPLTPVPIPIRLPFPPFATSVEEASLGRSIEPGEVAAVADDLRAALS